MIEYLLKLIKKISKNKDENNKTKSLKRCIMLILSITLHNIPEGLAVGVAFGGIAYGIEGATLSSALMIALGIGIQNFPEGTAVSVPLRREGLSRKKAFFFGQLSGIVEPISGVLGALLVLKVRTLLPFLLAFAAGAMIYVVVEELIPESQTNKKKRINGSIYFNRIFYYDDSRCCFRLKKTSIVTCLFYLLQSLVQILVLVSSNILASFFFKTL